MSELYQWELGGFPKWFMAKVVAWNRLHNLVAVHTQDALNRSSGNK